MYKQIMEEVTGSFAEGRVLLMDKPLEWTSFDVVKKIRTLIRVSKVGHAGTLDPLATGLLIVCTGKFTKKINEYMAAEKEYTGTFTLGASTPTFDLESEPVFKSALDFLTPEMIHAATVPFTGEIMQVPPAHSAIKKGGTPSYILARKGKEVIMEPRKITIKSFEVTAIFVLNPGSLAIAFITTVPAATSGTSNSNNLETNFG